MKHTRAKYYTVLSYPSPSLQISQIFVIRFKKLCAVPKEFPIFAFWIIGLPIIAAKLYHFYYWETSIMLNHHSLHSHHSKDLYKTAKIYAKCALHAGWMIFVEKEPEYVKHDNEWSRMCITEVWTGCIVVLSRVNVIRYYYYNWLNILLHPKSSNDCDFWTF